jgi:hypothetical protein
VAMDATVVLTANHYVVDAVAGALLAHLGWHAAEHLRARRPSRLRTGPSKHGAPGRFAGPPGEGGARVAVGRP